MIASIITNWYKRNKGRAKTMNARTYFSRTYSWNGMKIDKTKPQFQMTVYDIDNDKYLTVDFTADYFARFVKSANDILTKPCA